MNVRHAQRVLDADKTVQAFGVLVQDSITEFPFELAELSGELRIYIGRRGQLTRRPFRLLLRYSEKADQYDIHEGSYQSGHEAPSFLVRAKTVLKSPLGTAGCPINNVH